MEVAEAAEALLSLEPRAHPTRQAVSPRARPALQHQLELAALQAEEPEREGWEPVDRRWAAEAAR